MNTPPIKSWRNLLPKLGSAYECKMSAQTLFALSFLLILVKLPHLLNLPVWVSATGMSLVAARMALVNHSDNRLLRAVLSPWCVTTLAIACALIIKWDFGYFLGRDPCVAFLFVLVGAKFAEVRRANDTTLLLCLCAFLILTQYFYSQSIVSALLTLPAVVALAYNFAILRDADNPETPSAQLKLIGMMLLQGMPLAAVLFVVFPRLPGPLWSLPEDAMATTGLTDTMSPGSIGELSQSGAVAFRVEFDGAVPASNALYWRGPVLTEFDGRTWNVSKRRSTASPQYNGPQEQLTNYTVTLQPHRQRWLFALESAASLPMADKAIINTDIQSAQPIGKMYADGQILSADSVSQALRYRQSSLLNNTTPALIRPRMNALFLPGLNRRTIAFAQDRRSRYDSDGDYVQSILSYFNREPYRYTLRPQILGQTPVDDFMFDTREGFCEHYAAAFVVLMRAAGIPARVVTGYQGGEMNEDYMIVRQSDAHAWAEAFINGVWMRFDPTSAVAPSRVERGLAAALPNEASVPMVARNVPGIVRNLQLRWDALNHEWQRLVIDFDNDSQESLWQRLGLSMPSLWQLCLGVIVLAGLWSAVVLGMPQSGKKRLSTQEYYWQKLSRLLHAHKLIRQPDETQSEYLRRAATHWPRQQLRLQELDSALTQLRFTQLSTEQHKTLLQQMKKQLRHMRWTLPLTRSSVG